MARFSDLLVLACSAIVSLFVIVFFVVCSSVAHAQEQLPSDNNVINSTDGSGGAGVNNSTPSEEILSRYDEIPQYEELPESGLQISPLRFYATVKPGDTWHGVVKVKNFSRKQQKVRILAEDFVVSDDTENITFYPSDQARHLKVPDIADWVTFSQTEVALAPGELRAIPFSLTVPYNAPTGGYYGAIFASIKTVAKYGDSSSGAQAHVAINTRVGALLIFAVHGAENAHVDGIVRAFLPLKKVFFISPARFRFAIKNSGNIHFRGSGTIYISRAGKTVAELPLPMEVNYPKKVRTYEQEWPFGLLQIGPYTATVHYESMSGLVKLEATDTFWVIPWLAIVLLLYSIILIIVVYRYVKSRYTIRIIRRKDKRHREIRKSRDVTKKVI